MLRKELYLPNEVIFSCGQNSKLMDPSCEDEVWHCFIQLTFPLRSIVVWRGELYEAVHQYLTPVETPDPDMTTTTATAFIGQLVTQYTGRTLSHARY